MFVGSFFFLKFPLLKTFVQESCAFLFVGSEESRGILKMNEEQTNSRLILRRLPAMPLRKLRGASRKVTPFLARLVSTFEGPLFLGAGRFRRQGGVRTRPVQVDQQGASETSRNQRAGWFSIKNV